MKNTILFEASKTVDGISIGIIVVSGALLALQFCGFGESLNHVVENAGLIGIFCGGAACYYISRTRTREKAYAKEFGYKY